MAEARDLRRTLDDLLHEQPEPQPIPTGAAARSFAPTPDATPLAPEDGAEAEEVIEIRHTDRFSPFDDDRMSRAAWLMKELEDLVEQTRDESGRIGTDFQAKVAEKMASEPDRGAFRHALLMLRTHNREIKTLGLVPPLEERAPLRMFPTAAPSDPERVEQDPELRMAWFREDPGLNEHHEQWHLVYPSGGIRPPAPGQLGEFKDRQGEIFFYMHQQMLARYDVERMTEGLPLVAPLEDYDAPIPEPYDPSELEGLPARWRDAIGARLSNVRLPDHPESAEWLSRIRTTRQRLDQLVERGRVSDDAPPFDIDALGAMTEPGDPARGQRIGLHNVGHMAIAVAVDPKEPLPEPWPSDQIGVMADTDTSMRDPVFWRWHRHIDNLAFRFQERHTQPYRWEDFEPEGIRIRSGLGANDATGASPDIFVVPASRLPEGLRVSTPHGVSRWFRDRFEMLQGWAGQAFGGNNWDRDPTGAGGDGIATDELRTFMTTREIRFDPVWANQGDVAQATISALDHEDFVVFVRIENTGATPVDVTLRLFLGPAEGEHMQNRRLWMELDKFLYQAPPGRSVAVQPSTGFSVVRKPARRLGIDSAIGEEDTTGNANGGTDFSYCNCGLPYSLLLPKGRADGMPFALYVIATRSSDDLVQASHCGSMSFCGSVDRYPDRREMGFPLNRPVTAWDALLEGPNRAWRGIRIVHGDAPAGWA